MPQNTRSAYDHQPIPVNPTLPAEDQGQAAEELHALEEVLERGRDGASADWLTAAEYQVDAAWLRWRRAAGGAFELD